MNTTEFTKAYQASRQLVVDIETMPNMEVEHLLPTPKIDSRLKDVEKIEAAMMDAKLEQIGKMALSPLTGKIACIGYWNDDIKEVHFGEESELLDKFWQLAQGKQLITYNGKGFDLPFIFKRGMINNRPWAKIKTMKTFCDRFKSENIHLDIMVEFCDYGKFEKMDNLASFILGEKKVEFDVTSIPELITTEEGRAKLHEYCLKDCEITWKLAKRMGY